MGGGRGKEEEKKKRNSSKSKLINTVNEAEKNLLTYPKYLIKKASFGSSPSE